MKSMVYKSLLDSAEDLVARVVEVDRINATPGVFETVRLSFIHRFELFTATLSIYIESFPNVNKRVYP